METKHTPLEIRIVETLHRIGGDNPPMSISIYYGISCDFKTKDEAMTYANHLIKCVNNHERLVEMVEKYLSVNNVSELHELNKQATQLLTDLKK